MEQFKNNAATTLNNGGSINNSSDPVNFTVTSAADFPTTGNFRVLIENEIMLVTSVAGNVFTASRAQEGTTIATHADGLAVTHLLTKGSLFQLLADFNMSGTFASRPAAGIAGRKYYATDTPFWYLDNGSTWDKFYGSYPIVTPDNTGYSWDNQSNVTLTTTKDMLTLGTTGTGAAGINARHKTAPSAPYIITAAFLVNPFPDSDMYAGIIWRDSGTGKITSLLARYNSTATIRANHWKWTDSSTFSAAYQNDDGLCWCGGLLFMRMEDDNTNRKVYWSADGVNFELYHTVGRTDFHTPNQVGFAIANVGTRGSISLIHWKQE